MINSLPFSPTIVGLPTSRSPPSAKPNNPPNNPDPLPPDSPLNTLVSIPTIVTGVPPFVFVLFPLDEPNVSKILPIIGIRLNKEIIHERGLPERPLRVVVFCVAGFVGVELIVPEVTELAVDIPLAGKFTTLTDTIPELLVNPKPEVVPFNERTAAVVAFMALTILLSPNHVVIALMTPPITPPAAAINPPPKAPLAALPTAPAALPAAPIPAPAPLAVVKAVVFATSAVVFAVVAPT